MGDYSRQKDFTAKDALSPGNPNKIILGADVDAEFDAVLPAVNGRVEKDVAQTITADHTFSGDLTFSGDANFSGTTQGLQGIPIGGLCPFAGTQAYVDANLAPNFQFLKGAMTLGAVGSGATYTNANYDTAFDIIKAVPWTDEDGLNANAGTETFGVDIINLPDLGGYVLAGQQDSAQTSRLDGTNNAPDDNTLADADGEQEHVMTVSEMAQHFHTDTGSGLVPQGAGAATALAGAGSHNTGSSGASSPHNTTQPTIIIGYVIRLI